MEIRSSASGPGPRHIKSRRAESILDFALAFIALAALTVGMLRIWSWFNYNQTKRMVEYQRSRIIAGTPVPAKGKPNYDQPVSIGQTEADPNRVFKPIDLTEEWVFKGETKPDDKITLPGGGSLIYVSPDEQCRKSVDQGGCDGAAGCGSGTEFDATCACYAHCYCNALIEPMVDSFEEQADNLEDQANQLKNAADELQDLYNRCNNWWEICAHGMNKKQLRQGILKLRAQVVALRYQATALRNRATRMQYCCDHYETLEEQKNCLDLITGGTCNDVLQAYIDEWNNQINNQLNPEIAQKQALVAEINNILNVVCPQQAYNLCHPPCNQQCSNQCNNQCSNQCNNQCSNQCNNQCSNQCSNDCTNQCTFGDDTNGDGIPDTPPYLHQDCYDACYPPCYDACYPPCYDACYPPCYDNCYNICYPNCYNPCYNPCYDIEINRCCRDDCCLGESWGRNCFAPTANCDDCPPPDGCVPTKCGLTEFKIRLEQEIVELQKGVCELQKQINCIAGCCGLPDANQRTECINKVINGCGCGGPCGDCGVPGGGGPPQDPCAGIDCSTFSRSACCGAGNGTCCSERFDVGGRYRGCYTRCANGHCRCL